MAKLQRQRGWVNSSHPQQTLQEKNKGIDTLNSLPTPYFPSPANISHCSTKSEGRKRAKEPGGIVSTDQLPRTRER